jgi:acetyl-CoA carboxylase/biotin carboxylase 1
MGTPEDLSVMIIYYRSTQSINLIFNNKVFIANYDRYIRMADHYVPIPGGAAHNNYSNVDLIVEIAQRTKVNHIITKVHAVWVGWGFASENPLLPDKLKMLDPEVIFIGPPSSAMRSLGDKIAATIVAQSATVPCVDWSGQGVLLKDLNNVVNVSPDIYERATVQSVEEG